MCENGACEPSGKSLPFFKNYGIFPFIRVTVEIVNISASAEDVEPGLSKRQAIFLEKNLFAPTTRIPVRIAEAAGNPRLFQANKQSKFWAPFSPAILMDS